MKNYSFEVNSELLVEVIVNKLHQIEEEINEGLKEFGITTEDDLMNLQYLISFYTLDNYKDEVVLNGKSTNAKELDQRIIAFGVALGCINVAKFTLEHKPYKTFIDMILMAESFLFSLKYSMPLNTQVIKDIQARHRIENATRAALTRIANDPKQLAKQYIFNCWEVWQEEPEKYKSKADFAKMMLKLEQCKCLVSQKKIEDWCRDFEKKSSLN